MYKEKIGLIGGFGAYATMNFYKRLLEVFAGKTEREYPHIMMDNDFTMPSRTRAILYDEEYECVVDAIAESIKKLKYMKCDYIIMICGTAHIFLNDIYMKYPELKGSVFDIIDCLVEEMEKEKIKECMIIAAEGTLKSKLFENKLQGITCFSPSESDYKLIRYFIEGVKKNCIDDVMIDKFVDFTNRQTNIILGCTEFPILVQEVAKNYPEWYESHTFFDPLEICVNKLKRVIK